MEPASKEQLEKSIKRLEQMRDTFVSWKDRDEISRTGYEALSVAIEVMRKELERV
jgi:hypothetical protein